MSTGSNEPCYVISVAARMVGVPTHTLRYYERVGIIEPTRSPGNIRLYSDEDIVLLRRVRKLMDDLGVNLAGVSIILRMRRRIIELQGHMGEVESEIRVLWGYTQRFSNDVRGLIMLARLPELFSEALGSGGKSWIQLESFSEAGDRDLCLTPLS